MEVWENASYCIALGIVGVQMSPLGGIYTYPDPQWMAEIALIQWLLSYI